MRAYKSYKSPLKPEIKIYNQPVLIPFYIKNQQAIPYTIYGIEILFNIIEIFPLSFACNFIPCQKLLLAISVFFIKTAQCTFAKNPHPSCSHKDTGSCQFDNFYIMLLNNWMEVGVFDVSINT